MDQNNFPYKYIAIEGNIGAGKTSFCELLQKETNCKLILEEFKENPFLPLFYKDPDRYAFTLELFFMTERYKQFQSSMLTADMFSDYIISDYFFTKTLLFARKNLPDHEYKLFLKLYGALENGIPQPDLLIYFHRNVDILLQNIQRRARSYELKIKPEYLLGIQDSYFEYLRNIRSFPVLIIDLQDIDFVKNKSHYDEVKRLMTKTYQPGVHRMTLVV